MRPKPIVGLTGGIACGKSTVASFFRELNVAVVDADQIAREVVAPASEGLEEIVRTFGTSILLPDGGLDRAKLGDMVFADGAARTKLNAITHPRIAVESQRQLVALMASDSPYVIYEAALLVEANLYGNLDCLVVVTVSPETQLERLMNRDQSKRDMAQARIGSQMPLSEKVAVADYVIHNDGTREDTRSQVCRVHEALMARLGVPS